MVDEQRDRAVDAVAAHGQAFGHGRGEAILLRRLHPLHALAFERDPVPDRRRHIPSPSVWSVLTMGGGGLQDETCRGRGARRSEEHTSELQSLMRISYAVFCLKK